MAMKDARDFIHKAKTDRSIQKELHEGKKHPVDIGRDHGLHFTKEEHDKAMRERDMPAAAGETWCSNT